MKIKIFGKELFAYHSRNSDYYAIPAINALKESKYLPDFRQTIDDGWSNPAISQGISGNWAIATDTRSDNAGGMVAIPIQNTPKTGAEKKEAKKLTPKKVYSLQMLYDKEFTVNMDPKYVDEQIKQFKDKLSLIKAEEYDMRRGTEEIASVLVRMENRKKYAKHAKFYSQYPYTTRARIQSVLGKHDYLKLGQVAQFVADMPKEATDTMKAYNEQTEALCGKKAVFYIIANKKDFQKTNQRRDPILLAQSPFGHFWQILGAWDDEMILLEEL